MFRTDVNWKFRILFSIRIAAAYARECRPVLGSDVVQRACKVGPACRLGLEYIA